MIVTLQNKLSSADLPFQQVSFCLGLVMSGKKPANNKGKQCKNRQPQSRRPVSLATGPVIFYIERVVRQ